MLCVWGRDAGVGWGGVGGTSLGTGYVLGPAGGKGKGRTARSGQAGRQVGDPGAGEGLAARWPAPTYLAGWVVGRGGGCWLCLVSPACISYPRCVQYRSGLGGFPPLRFHHLFSTNPIGSHKGPKYRLPYCLSHQPAAAAAGMMPPQHCCCTVSNRVAHLGKAGPGAGPELSELAVRPAIQ